MKTHLPYAFLMCLLCTGFLANAQTNRFALQLSDINFQAGALHHVPNFVNIQESAALYPTSSILSQDYSDYDYHSGFDEVSAMGTVSLGFEFKARPAFGVRAGVALWQRTYFESYLESRTSTPYDTLVSSQTGYPIYIELHHDRATQAQFSGTFVNLDLAFEFKTITDTRWQFRTGVGLQTGIILNTSAEVRASDNYSSNPNFNYIYSELEILSDPAQNENIRGKNHFNAAIYVPMNFGFALGKKNEFLKRLQFNVQALPTFNFLSASGVAKADEITFSHTYGLRYSFK